MNDSKVMNRQHILSIKNVTIFVLCLVVFVGFHMNSKLRHENSQSQISVTQLRDRIEALEENAKAIVETRNQCLKNLRNAKNEVLDLRKSIGDRNNLVQAETEKLKEQLKEMEVKYNNLQSDYSKVQEAGSVSNEKLKKDLESKQEELQLLKTQKESEISALKDRAANLERENEEIRKKAGNLIPDKKPEVPAQNNAQQVVPPGESDKKYPKPEDTKVKEPETDFEKPQDAAKVQDAQVLAPNANLPVAEQNKVQPALNVPVQENKKVEEQNVIAPVAVAADQENAMQNESEIPSFEE